jgi:ATP-dependent Clp protease ATP-binding subunit ClpA
MFERMTDRARRSIVLAQHMASAVRAKEIQVIHLLAGIAEEGEGIGAQVLQGFRITRDDIMAFQGQGDFEPTDMGNSYLAPFSLEARKVFEFALREALQFHHGYIGQEHLLLAIVREEESLTARSFLIFKGLSPSQIRQAVISKMGGDSPKVDAVVTVAPDEIRRIILFSRNRQDWQPLPSPDRLHYHHPLLTEDVIHAMRAKEDSLRHLLEVEGSEVEITYPDGWKVIFKLEEVGTEG